jgi:hypothetical protein
MPKSWKRWSLFAACAALLSGCYATAAVPYYGADYYGAPRYRTYGYYAPPAVVVRARPAWGYGSGRVYVHERGYGSHYHAGPSHHHHW